MHTRKRPSQGGILKNEEPSKAKNVWGGLLVEAYRCRSCQKKGDFGCEHELMRLRKLASVKGRSGSYPASKMFLPWTSAPTVRLERALSHRRHWHATDDCLEMNTCTL